MRVKRVRGVKGSSERMREKERGRRAKNKERGRGFKGPRDQVKRQKAGDKCEVEIS